MKKELNLIELEQSKLYKRNTKEVPNHDQKIGQHSIKHDGYQTDQTQIPLAKDQLTKNQKINQSHHLNNSETQKQSYVLAFPYKTDPVCQPFIPITFYDSINFEQQKIQIQRMLDGDLIPQKLIKWIQQNNKKFFNYTGNCSLLELIESEFIWKNVLPTMLHDVKNHSRIIGKGKLRYLTTDKYGLQKMEINRYCCYLILCQMFFGLIPLQYQHMVQHMDNPSHHKIVCSFANLMHRQSLSNNGKSNQCQQITEDQISRLNKLKALLYYFIKMQCQAIQKLTQTQTITLECVANNLDQKTLNHPKKFQYQKQHHSDAQEYYGTIGDESLPDLEFIQPKPRVNENKAEFTKEGPSNYNMKEVSAFVEINQFIDEQKAQRSKNYYMVKFIFEHPQTFIVKFLMQVFPEGNQCLIVSGPKRYAHCLFSKNQRFQTISDTKVEEILNPSVQSCGKIIFIQRQTAQLSIEDYSFDLIEKRIAMYVNSIKAMIKSHKSLKVVVNLDQMVHKDFYLNFLQIWVAMSPSSNSKNRFSFKLQGLGQEKRYNIEKLYKHFMNGQAGDILSVITGYDVFLKAKKDFIKNINELPFIEYIKKHVA